MSVVQSSLFHLVAEKWMKKRKKRTKRTKKRFGLNWRDSCWDKKSEVKEKRYKFVNLPERETWFDETVDDYEGNEQNVNPRFNSCYLFQKLFHSKNELRNDD